MVPMHDLSVLTDQKWAGFFWQVSWGNGALEYLERGVVRDLGPSPDLSVHTPASLAPSTCIPGSPRELLHNTRALPRNHLEVQWGERCSFCLQGDGW